MLDQSVSNAIDRQPACIFDNPVGPRKVTLDLSSEGNKQSEKSHPPIARPCERTKKVAWNRSNPAINQPRWPQKISDGFGIGRSQWINICNGGHENMLQKTRRTPAKSVQNCHKTTPMAPKNFRRILIGLYVLKPEKYRRTRFSSAKVPADAGFVEKYSKQFGFS